MHKTSPITIKNYARKISESGNKSLLSLHDGFHLASSAPDPSTPFLDFSSPPSSDYSEYIFQKNKKKIVETFTYQASGHSKIFTIENNSRIVKPKNPHEDTVYRRLQTTHLKEYAAPYYGVLRIDEIEADVRKFQQKGEFIVLGNLTAQFKHPCVMDLKLGRKFYMPGVDPKEKMYIRKIKSGATTAGSLGFRISGMRVYQPLTDTYVVRKSIRRNRMISDKNGLLTKMLALFFHNGVKFRMELVEHFIEKLQALHDALSSDTTFDFRASSVLLCYEGDVSIGTETEPVVDVRIIDFDHTIIKKNPNGEDQSGIRYGIANLIDSFKRLFLFSDRKTQVCLNSEKVDEGFGDDDGVVRSHSMPHARSKKVLPRIVTKDKLE